ncbi:hypothetical protein BGZ54_000531 [Gamsiella multidivaricata]|nr:hypothetical protein BGZ54_000531 [Gamsiella multidivaricata]
MFATNSHATNASNAPSNAPGLNTWLQDVLDYSSFSDDAHSPVLPIESFDPSSAFSFPDFSMPLTISPAQQEFQDMSLSPTFQPLPTTSRADIGLFNGETARQAALLHAYLAAQGQSIGIPQQWMAPAMTLPTTEPQQMQGEEQQKQQEQEEQRQHMARIQRSDAENLARYLAQTQQQIKQESSSETAMEYDSVSVPHSPSPSSSTASEAGDKSPSTSPTLAERSLSPETPSGSNADMAGKTGSSSAKSSSRQLECFNCKVTQTPLWRRTPDRKHSLCNACGLYFKQYGAHRPLNARHKLPTVLASLGTLPYARPTSGQSSRGPSPGPSSPTSPLVAQDSSSSASSSSDSDSDSSHGHDLTSVFPDLTALYTQALLPPSPVKKVSPPLMTAKQGIQCKNCLQTQTPLWRKNDAGEPICNACGLYAKLHHRDRPVTMRKAKISRRRRDWGGNLAHRAQAQAQALAAAHVQALTQAQKSVVEEQADAAATIVEEMSGKAMGRSSMAVASDSEDETLQRQQQSVQSFASSAAVAAPAPVPVPSSSVAQSLSNNLILDEHKFADVVGLMNAHQMNRFLSILESRCG